MSPDELRALTLIEVRDAIANGAVTSVEVVEAALDQAQRFDESHRLFVTLTADSALSAARAADAARAAGTVIGPLHGVPITIKDNVDVAAVPGTAATKVLAGRVPEEHATVAARLFDAGAINLGKVNMHEMAMGGTSINPHYGTVGNPWSLDHVAGGSSGASAAAVALQVGYAALGTDAAGSVRIPSSCCGIVGLKQTHGLVPLRGGMPTTTQHADHIGPHARTVGDARAMLEVMQGYDPADPHSSSQGAPPSAPLKDLRGIAVGLPESYFWEDLDPDVDAACRSVVAMMQDAGAEVVPVGLEEVGRLMPLVRAASSAESYVYHEPMLREHPELYSDELRYRLLAGQYVLAHDYVRGMRARRLVIEAVREAFQQVDILAMPTLPEAPPRVEDSPPTFEGSRRLIRNTAPFNQTGTPAISLPVAVTAERLPVGFMLAADAFQDYRLLAVAEVVESLVGFDTTPPVLEHASVAG